MAYSMLLFPGLAKMVSKKRKVDFLANAILSKISQACEFTQNVQQFRKWRYKKCWGQCISQIAKSNSCQLSDMIFFAHCDCIKAYWNTLSSPQMWMILHQHHKLFLVTSTKIRKHWGVTNILRSSLVLLKTLSHICLWLCQGLNILKKLLESC